MRRRAVISADLGNFAFFLPMTARIWRDRIGYGTLAILVGDEKLWRASATGSLVLREIAAADGEIRFSGDPGEAHPGLVSVMARCHVGRLDFSTDDYFLISDADMWPIDASHFLPPTQDMSKRIHLHYANAYRGEWFPMCYIGAALATWREIMNLPLGPLMPPVLEAIARYSRNPDEWNSWMRNEHYFSSLLKRWRGFPSECQFIDRPAGHPLPDRIDRVCWPPDLDEAARRSVDAHLMRPGHTSPNWDAIFGLYSILQPSESEWARAYREQYVLEGKAT